ncbi:unnamed protein product [Orchesella dallaii]|uniref:Ragulator complex protein LAMTOR1 n=1 Tax=Orchesella dallaii TaxID=48710 RepID=A0ABP1R5C2_9HEXA
MKIMGCCFSCKDDDDAQGGETSERQQLLRDPVSNSTPVVRVPNSDSRSSVTAGPDGQPVRGQEDELQRILQETASAMIDVSGSGSHSLDQREFQERSRHYLQKIQTLSPTLLRGHNLLLCDVPIPEKHLNVPLLSEDDLDLMAWATDEIQEALHSIRVEHCEDLVVPFGCTQTAALQSSPSP